MADEGAAVAISVDAEDIGRRMKRTKKRIVWKFCFGAGGMEHTVELKHSTLTGKKAIAFDGEDVHHITNPLTPDFDHTFLVAQHEVRVRLIAESALVGPDARMHLTSLAVLAFLTQPEKQRTAFTARSGFGYRAHSRHRIL